MIFSQPDDSYAGRIFRLTSIWIIVAFVIIVGFGSYLHLDHF
jgi:hypothetical protein